MPETHVPVLVNVIARLASGRSRFVDCTVGDGGHAVRLMSAGGSLVAIDRDPRAIESAQAVLDGSEVTWLNCSYADPEALEVICRFRPDFVLLDLGVSSRQLDSDFCGFSFRRGVPLDMRMNPEEQSTAADLLNSLEAEELERMFRKYADERGARRLAGTIVRRRGVSRFSTSDDLVNAIRAALGSRTGPSTFARLFQAVRIEVNGEIRALQSALPALLEYLEPDGLMAVISYHSVEDRVVKRLFREWAKTCVCPAGVPLCSCRGHALGIAEPRKPIRPTEHEITSNPRARSAKLRVFRKAHAPQR